MCLRNFLSYNQEVFRVQVNLMYVIVAYVFKVILLMVQQQYFIFYIIMTEHLHVAKSSKYRNFVFYLTHHITLVTRSSSLKSCDLDSFSFLVIAHLHFQVYKLQKKSHIK